MVVPRESRLGALFAVRKRDSRGDGVLSLGDALAGDSCCQGCTEDCGWVSCLNELVTEAPVLLSACLGLREHDGPLYVLFRVPAAQPAVAASAAHLVFGLAQDEIEWGVVVGQPAVGSLPRRCSADCSV